MDYPVGRLYVSKYFNEQSKAAVSYSYKDFINDSEKKFKSIL